MLCGPVCLLRIIIFLNKVTYLKNKSTEKTEKAILTVSMTVIRYIVKDYSLEKEQEQECTAMSVRFMKILCLEHTECTQAKIPI